MILRLTLLAAGPTCASAAFSQNMSNVGHMRPGINAVVMDYEVQAKSLQREMAALQRWDDGRLTPEHRAYLQAKASSLIAAYHRDLAAANPLSINADGTRAR
jgi:hypothetical protein